MFGVRAGVQCQAGLGRQEVEPAGDVHAERLLVAQPAGAPARAVGGQGALHSGLVGGAVVMDMPEHQEPGKLTAGAGRPGIVPVEHGQLARGPGQHVVGVQVPVAGDQPVPGHGGHQISQVAQQAGVPGHRPRPAGSLPARGIRELVPGRRPRNGVIPGVDRTPVRPGQSMQPSRQVANLNGQSGVGQVHGHAVNPPVQPQPATTITGGQLLEEPPAPARQAARQPDTGRLQVCGEGCFLAYRLLVRFPEQFLDGVALRAQIQAPDSSHRPPRHRDQRGPGFRRQPECAADQLNVLAAATDHAPRQPAADDHGNLAGQGRAAGRGGPRTRRANLRRPVDHLVSPG